tara:strand:- start:1150 stop:1473 length:324 start_codon:yes stop_codon:yes gene_type:complete
MKITKSHLKRIILEELGHFEEGVFPHSSGNPALTMIGDKNSPTEPDDADLLRSMLQGIMDEYQSAGSLSPDTLQGIQDLLASGPEQFEVPADGQSEPVPPTDGEVEA